MSNMKVLTFSCSTFCTMIILNEGFEEELLSYKDTGLVTFISSSSIDSSLFILTHTTGHSV